MQKQLTAMRKAGGKGEQAAHQGEQILKYLENEDLLSKVLLSKRTKHGECRIENCVKYDLGHGYRLVTVKNGEHLFIPFVGSHDKTDQWIEHHRDSYFSPDDKTYTCEERQYCNESKLPRLKTDGGKKHEHDDSYEANLQARIDQRLLQSIFKGLYHGR